MSDVEMSDTLASDNESSESTVSQLETLTLEEPALPVDMPLSAESLTAEVQRLSKVVGILCTRFDHGFHGTSFDQVLEKLNLLLQGQKTLVECKSSGTATEVFTVSNVSLQTEPEQRAERTVEAKGEAKDKIQVTLGNGALTPEDIASLFEEMKGFDKKQANRYCNERKLNIFEVAANLKKHFPQQKRVWFRAKVFTRAVRKKSKATPVKQRKQLECPTIKLENRNCAVTFLLSLYLVVFRCFSFMVSWLRVSEN